MSETNDNTITTTNESNINEDNNVTNTENTIVAENSTEQENKNNYQDFFTGDIKQEQKEIDPLDMIPNENEDYEFTPIDGQELSEVDKQAYSSLSREIGLTKRQAQKLYENGNKRILESQAQMMNKYNEQWLNEVKADKELGGVNFENTKQNLAAAMSQYGSEELKTLLNQTRLGNHPEIVRFINRVGKSLRNDDFFIKGKEIKPQTNPYESLFPNYKI